MMMMVFLKSIGQLPVFKNLQQDVEDIRMRLLDFVEQNDGVGSTLDAFGELATFFVTHISWRRTDQLRNAVLLHELRHIETDKSFVAAKHKVR
jgi:hypothetical protein